MSRDRGTCALPPQQHEEDLLAAARAGDRGATAMLAERFLPLVRGIARRHHPPGGGEDLDDLIQVGMIGLLEAISRYDPERGAFAPYAAATVSGTVKRHFRDRGWRVRVPRSLHDRALAVARAGAELESRLGREPATQELAEVTGMPAEAVEEARRLLASASPLSLQAAAGAELPSLEESLGLEDAGFDRSEMRAMIGRLTSSLDRRDRSVLALRFGLDQTQSEIARRIGVSQMQVSRLLGRAIGTMRRQSERESAPEPAPDREVA